MAQKQENLSKNQKIVLDIIEKSAQPMKAYSIPVSYTHLTLPTKRIV